MTREWPETFFDSKPTRSPDPGPPLLAEAGTALTPAQCRRASLVVAERSTDPEDCLELLRMLGLQET